MATKRRTKKASTKRKPASKKATPRKKATAGKKATPRKKATAGKKRKPSAAFMAPMTPSAALAEVIGTKAIPRTQVVKKLWLYIKKHKLQDPKNRRNIRADKNLLKVFQGQKVVNMFQMTKLVSKQLKKAA